MPSLRNTLLYSGAALSVAAGVWFALQSSSGIGGETDDTIPVPLVIDSKDKALLHEPPTSEPKPLVTAVAAEEQAAHEREIQSLSEMAKSAPQRLMAPSPMSDMAVSPNIRPDVVYVEEQVDIGNIQSTETNPLKKTSEEAVSTFSIDVDTASYSMVRRMLNQGRLPQVDTVRIEEMLNYFDYQYPKPESTAVPFEPTIVVQPSPWAKGKQLVHIGIKGYDIESATQPDSNLVLLLDVSGSMSQPDKLPLVKQSMELLLSTLKPTDTISIVVYAGAAGEVLPPTKVADKQKILSALTQLQAGGSTAGGQGIELAYALAEQNFNKEAVNRIIIATDGDFNVGISDPKALKSLVERKRESGVYLSVLGFGRGNYNDHLMQELAQNGNGVAAYIDSLSEAQKVLVHQATSNLFTIAKDVKIQVEFNPATVSEYRLIGYETRALKREDFNNDKVDAGDVGAGHSVTAIYEITPVGSEAQLIDESRYQQGRRLPSDLSDEYGFLKIRYKLPNENTSRLIEKPIKPSLVAQGILQQEVNFAIAVAAFGERLRSTKYINDYSFDAIIDLAQAHKGSDDYGYRSEFVQLVRKAKLAKL